MEWTSDAIASKKQRNLISCSGLCIDGMAKLQKQNSELNLKLSNNYEIIRNYQQKFTDVKNELKISQEGFGKQIRELNAQIDQSNQNNSTLNTINKNLNSRLSQETSKLNEKSEKLLRITEEHASLKTIIQILQQTLERDQDINDSSPSKKKRPNGNDSSNYVIPPGNYSCFMFFYVILVNFIRTNGL